MIDAMIIMTGIAVLAAITIVIATTWALRSSSRDAFLRGSIPDNNRATEHLNLTPNEVRIMTRALDRYRRKAIVFGHDNAVLSELKQKLISLKQPRVADA